MAKILEAKYDPKKVESGKYDFWLKGGFFTAGDKNKIPYNILHIYPIFTIISVMHF